jgi:toxin ParE1/3/4
MPQLIKRPIVIQDLIDISTYISYENLDAGDRFIYAAQLPSNLLPNLLELEDLADLRIQKLHKFVI